MKDIASKLEKKGYILRSGGAKGADSAFESGVKNHKNKEIYYKEDATDLAREIAKKFHPNPFALKDFSLNLMARNTFQIMGKELNTPDKFVILYTPDGCKHHKQRTQKTGGTGQAISIASHFNIPIYNLFYQEDIDFIYNNYIEEK